MRKTKSISRKSWFLVVLSFIFILLSPPFYFYSMYFPSKIIPGAIRALILCYLLLNINTARGKHLINNAISCGTFLVFYTLFSVVLNIDYAAHLAHISMCLLFSVVVFIYIMNYDEYVIGVKIILKALILLISFSVIISPVLFLFMPSLFIQMFFDDYYITFNPLLGSIETQGFRPCWYFAEPSYCGFFLGLSLLLVLGMDMSKKNKLIFSSIIIVAVIVSNSMSSILFLAPSLFIWLIRNILNRKFYSLILGISLVIVNVSIVTVDFDSLLEKYEVSFKKKNSSFEDRKDKIVNSRRFLQSMGVIDFIIGAGIDSSADKFGTGESNGYYKLICEYGIIFTLVFLIVANRLTSKDMAIKTFFFLSLMSVIIFWTPVVLLLLMIVYRGVNSPPNIAVGKHQRPQIAV